MIKSAEQDSGLYTFAMLGFGVYRFHSFDTAMRFYSNERVCDCDAHLAESIFQTRSRIVIG